MALLSQHEAFLRAIFDDPDDDTPRLVYADFLEENGDPDRAEFIRLDCAWTWLKNDPSQAGRLGVVNLGLAELRRQHPADWPWHGHETIRGFPRWYWDVTVSVSQFLDHPALRSQLVLEKPEYFAARGVKFYGGRITSAEPFDALFGLGAFARVTELNLQGEMIVTPDLEEPELEAYELEPVITTAGLEALIRHRGVRRITALILTNNDLDNDAARALVKSPYLDNLKRLELLQGNRLRGKVWQQVIERFGEDVVG